jgi:hypothetical protein
MPADSVGDEISRLVRKGPSRGPQSGRPYGRDQAVAAALNMGRKGAFGRKAKRRKLRNTGRGF